MSDFQSDLADNTSKAVTILRKWHNEKAAKVVQREYLSEQGLKFKESTKLEELLDARHNMGLDETLDPEVRLKAINASLEMAAGSEKITNVNTNTQINFGDYLDKI